MDAFEENDLLLVPPILQFVCELVDSRRDEPDLIADAATILGRSREDIAEFFRNHSDERGALVDVLRMRAVTEESLPVHALADELLFSFVLDCPDLALVKRLTDRVDLAVRAVGKFRRFSVQRRAGEIASARVELIAIVANADQNGVLSTPLNGYLRLREAISSIIATAQRASASLDAEIAEFRTREQADHPDEDEDPLSHIPVMNPDGTDENLDANTEPGDSDAVDDDDEQSDTAPVESLVIFSRMPLATTRDAKAGIKPFEELINEPLPLVSTPDLQIIRSRLLIEFPHLQSAVDALLASLAPHRSVRLQPSLLVGPPGSGKTTMAQRLLELLEVPYQVIDVAGRADGMVLGSSRKWGNGAAGVHLDLFAASRTANIALLVDELDKSGGSSHNGDFRAQLLGLIEPRRAASFIDPFLEVPIDVSAVVWIATANDIATISAPLLNRLWILHCPHPGPEHLEALAPQMAKALLNSRGLTSEWFSPFSQMELEALTKYWPGGSLRDLRRYIEVVLDARDRELGCG